MQGNFLKAMKVKCDFPRNREFYVFAEIKSKESVANCRIIYVFH